MFRLCNQERLNTACSATWTSSQLNYCSKFRYSTFKRMINKDTDQTALMRSLICAFDVCKKKMFVLMLYVPINSFQSCRDESSWVTSTKPGLMVLLKDTTQCCRLDSNQQPFYLESSTLPLSHCAPPNK